MRDCPPPGQGHGEARGKIIRGGGNAVCCVVPTLRKDVHKLPMPAPRPVRVRGGLQIERQPLLWATVALK